MMTREIRTWIDIDASPEAVWDVLTDLEQFEEWNPFITKAEGVVKEGERISVFLKPEGKKGMSFRPTLLVTRPREEMRWLGKVPGFHGEHVFRIEPRNGGVRFEQSETFTGFLTPLLMRRLGSPTEKGFRKMNRALKERAEAMYA